MSLRRFKNAMPVIAQFYDEFPVKVHRKSDLNQHLIQNEPTWSLGPSASVDKFTKWLLESTKLTELRFNFPEPYRAEIRYLWGKVPLYEVIQTIKPGCYFSHHTAAKFHGLVEQTPKTTYLTCEQRNSSISVGQMNQTSIDRAFQGNPRVSRNIAESKSFRVCIVAGRNTSKLGVVEQKVLSDVGPLRLTNLERTLIDLTVRPIYAGGVFEVAKAFEMAKDRLSVHQLVAMLKKLEYTYPYHQAIGFYLERVGYKSSDVDLFRGMPMDFDFYLTHKMGKTEYMKPWRLHVPQGF